MSRKDDGGFSFRNVMAQAQPGECGTRPGENNPPEPVHYDRKRCKEAVVKALEAMYGSPARPVAADSQHQERFPFMEPEG